MRRASLAVLVLATAAASRADPKAGAPNVLSARLVDDITLHFDDQSGTMRTYQDSRVTVALGVDHELDVRITGTHGSESFFADPHGRQGTSGDDATWTAHWTGTWKEATSAGTLALDLDFASEQCTRTLSHDRLKSKATCKPPARHAHLGCATEQVELDAVPRAPSTPKIKVAAWRCTAVSSTDLGESPPDWLLGKAACIESGDMSELHACPP